MNLFFEKKKFVLLMWKLTLGYDTPLMPLVVLHIFLPIKVDGFVGMPR